MTEPPAGMFDGKPPIDTNADLVSTANYPTTNNSPTIPHTPTPYRKPPVFAQPITYLFLLLLLALLLLLGTAFLFARRRATRRSAAHRAGVHALALDVEAASHHHPRALSPSIPLPPPSRGWRFAHLLHLPALSLSRTSLSANSDWELDIDDAGFAPPPYEAERKGVTEGVEAEGGAARMSEAELLGPIAAAGRLPGYEEAMDGRCFRADEVSPRTAAAGAVRVPERAARRASDSGQIRRSGEDREDMRDDDGRRGRNSQ